MDALGARFERVASQLVVMGLPPYAALDAVQRGAGGAEQLSTLAHYIVFTSHLCNQGYVGDDRDVAARAQQALETGFLCQCLSSCIDHLGTDALVFCP